MKKINNELELEEDLKQQHLEWKLKRAGWLIMLLFVFACLFGLTGQGGILNKQKTGGPAEGMEIEYSRFLRKHAQDELEIALRQEDGQHETSLFLGKEFLENVKIDHFSTEPVSMQAGKDGVTYFFRTGGSATLTLFIEAQKAGKIQTRMALAGKEPLEFTQFVYP